jgi:hypothetical protein
MAKDRQSLLRTLLASALAAPLLAAFVYVAGATAYSLLSPVLNMSLGELLAAATFILTARCLFQHVLVATERERERERERAKALWSSAALLGTGFMLSAWALQQETAHSAAEFALLCGAMTSTSLGLLGGHYWRHAVSQRTGGWYLAAQLVPMLMPGALLVCGHGVSPVALIGVALHPGSAESTAVGTFVPLVHQVSQLAQLVAHLLH